MFCGYTLHTVSFLQAHLLREVCMFSMALELEERMKFYQTLRTFGFMPAVEGMLVGSTSLRSIMGVTWGDIEILNVGSFTELYIVDSQ